MVTLHTQREMANLEPGNIEFLLYEHYFPFSEGQTMEYKGHRCVYEGNVPHNAVRVEGGRLKRSRGPSARVFNAFLNQNQGGFLYLGIKDNGLICGMWLTIDQMEHIKEQFQQLCGGEVRPERVSINFIPVLQQAEHLREFKRGMKMRPQPRKDQAHELRIKDYCWCDKELAVQGLAGNPLYVVEAHVREVREEDLLHYSRATNMPLRDVRSLNRLYHENPDDNLYYERVADSTRPRDLVRVASEVQQALVDEDEFVNLMKLEGEEFDLESARFMEKLKIREVR